jgi:hypothetical protein
MNNKLWFLIFAVLVSLPFGDTLTSCGPSKYAFQLKTNGLQDISSFIPGTMISFKKMINSIEGIRITAGIYIGINNYMESPSQEFVTHESKKDSLSISLYATYLKYAYRNKKLYLYYGLGPFGIYSYQITADLNQQNKISTFSGGLNGCLGVEWFFVEHFSLFTEYNLNAIARYNRASTEIKGSNIVLPAQTTTNFNLISNNVLIGLSIYL